MITFLYIPKDQFYTLLGVILAICIFLLLREFFCWYWKINRTVELLESIDKKLSNNQALISSVKNIEQVAATSIDNEVKNSVNLEIKPDNNSHFGEKVKDILSKDVSELFKKK